MHSKAKREQWNWPKDGIAASAVGVIRGGSIVVAPWTNGGPGDTTSSKPRTEPANHFLHTTNSADQAQVQTAGRYKKLSANYMMVPAVSKMDVESHSQIDNTGFHLNSDRCQST